MISKDKDPYKIAFGKCRSYSLAAPEEIFTPTRQRFNGPSSRGWLLI
jgi:hypothetical protein